MGKLAWWLEKLFYIVIAFIAIIIFLWLFKAWGNEKIRYFLFVGDAESVAIVLLVTTAVGWLLEKLWKWEVHSVFRPHARQKRVK